MGCTICSDQTGTIQRKRHIQILQGNVMNQLIIGTLQKGRVNRDNRLLAFASDPRSKRDRMLFSNPHVKVTAWKAAVKLHHAAAFAHGGSNTDQTRIVIGHIVYPVSKYLCKGGFRCGGRFLNPDRWIKFPRSVIQNGIGFCQLVALPLFGHDV